MLMARLMDGCLMCELGDFLQASAAVVNLIDVAEGQVAAYLPAFRQTNNADDFAKN